jgi:hypothetical protein
MARKFLCPQTPSRHQHSPPRPPFALCDPAPHIATAATSSDRAYFHCALPQDSLSPLQPARPLRLLCTKIHRPLPPAPAPAGAPDAGGRGAGPVAGAAELPSRRGAGRAGLAGGPNGATTPPNSSRRGAFSVPMTREGQTGPWARATVSVKFLSRRRRAGRPGRAGRGVGTTVQP